MLKFGRNVCGHKGPFGVIYGQILTIVEISQVKAQMKARDVIFSEKVTFGVIYHSFFFTNSNTISGKVSLEFPGGQKFRKRSN